jgi:hypothetical protein
MNDTGAYRRSIEREQEVLDLIGPLIATSLQSFARL